MIAGTASESDRAYDKGNGTVLASYAEQGQSPDGASQAAPTHKHEPDAQVQADSNTQSQQQHQAQETVSSSANALQVLRRLQTLPWRRIDVSFQHSRMPFFAHNHIQVTRKWLNWEGAAVCEHLAKQLADMEKDECIQHLILDST